MNECMIPATPTTLIALLRVVTAWRQDVLAQNVQEVAELGRQLCERIVVFASQRSEVGGRLDKVVEAYNKSVGMLEPSVLVSVRRLREIKATSDARTWSPLNEENARALQAAGSSEGQE